MRQAQLQLHNHAVKFYMAIHATFRQGVHESIKTFPPIVLQTNQMELYPDDDLDPMLKSCSEQLQNKITFYEGTGPSGWSVSSTLVL